MTHIRLRIALGILIIGMAASYKAKPQQEGQIVANAPFMGTCTLMQNKIMFVYECEIQPHNIALLKI